MSPSVMRLTQGEVRGRLPRAWLAVTATVALALLAPAQSEAGQVPRYDELPVGAVTAPPTSARPASIPADASVAGLVVRAAGPSQTIVTTEDAPPPGDRSPSRPGRACFSQMIPTSPAFSSPAAVTGLAQRPGEWEGALALQGNVWGPPHAHGVAAVHFERVIERAGTASLESTDVWIDPATRGARLIAKATLPLRQVGSVPGGARLFVGRDERPDGKRYLQVIVTRTLDTAAPQLNVLSGTRNGSMLLLGSCVHERVALLANKPGESASIQLTTVLPPLPPGEPSFAPRLPPPPTPGATNTREVRTRAVRIHASVSQTTRDKEPILAVSTAWAGPEINQRLFGAAPIPAPMPTPAPTAAVRVPPPPAKHAGMRGDPGF